jgi:effector-binding domain-containing protein
MEHLMEPAIGPDFHISPMRLLTLREIVFFHVTNQPTALANLDRDLDPLLDSLYAAKAQAGLGEAGPDIVRYYKAEPDPGAPLSDPGLHVMEVGIPVKPGTQPAGDARIKVLPPCRCAGVLLWGSLAHIVQAYTELTRAIEAAGMRTTGECREWTYWFESPDSPNNLMSVWMGVC